jgi:hypothetical protein
VSGRGGGGNYSPHLGQYLILPSQFLNVSLKNCVFFCKKYKTCFLSSQFFYISHCFLRVQGCLYTIQPCTRQLYRVLNDRATSNHNKVGKTPIMDGSLAFGLYALDYQKLPSGLHYVCVIHVQISLHLAYFKEAVSQE